MRILVFLTDRANPSARSSATSTCPTPRPDFPTPADDSGSGILPVVLHGTVPEGATATVDVEPNLTHGSGTRCRVTVELKDGQMCSTEFTT